MTEPFDNLTPIPDPKQSGGSSDSPSSIFPKILGDFELLEVIGRGGMGTVYRARQRSLKRTVAVKVLSQQVSSSANAVVRFQREAQAAAKLHHQHIVPIFSLCEDNDVYFYAMELVEGPVLHSIIAAKHNGRATDVSASGAIADDLADTVLLTPNSTTTTDPSLVDTQPLLSQNNPHDSAVKIQAPSTANSDDAHYLEVAKHMASVADALHYAHQQGVIHRDIKPHNLIFGVDGLLRITDFGLARLSEQPGVTVTGELIGSPLYMAPEQLKGDTGPADPRTDIYALGATLYEWLTFLPPYPGDTREQVISKILTTEALTVRTHDPDIPVDLETICAKAIERDVRHRYQTAAELRDDLQRYLAHKPIHARRAGVSTRIRKYARRHQLGLVGTAAAVIALILSGMLLNTRRQVRSQEEAVAEIVAENQRLRGVIDNLPFEIVAPLRLAEAAAPLLERMMNRTRSAVGFSSGVKPQGADPTLVNTPVGLAQRTIRDYYEFLAPNGWPAGATGEGPDDSFLLRSAIENWSTNPAQALVAMDEYIESKPQREEQYEAWQLKSALQGRLGDYDDMLASTNRLVELEPEVDLSHTWRALGYLLNGRASEGLPDADLAVAYSAHSVWSLTLKGLVLAGADRTLEAVFTYNHALELDPDQVLSLLGRASVRAVQGQTYDAVTDLSHVLELEPHNADALAFRGDQYVLLGEFGSAAQDFALAMDLAGGSTPMMARYLGVLSRQQQLESDSSSVVQPRGETEIDITSVESDDVGLGEDRQEVISGWLTHFLRQVAPKKEPSHNTRNKLNLTPYILRRFIH